MLHFKIAQQLNDDDDDNEQSTVSEGFVSGKLLFYCFNPFAP